MKATKSILVGVFLSLGVTSFAQAQDLRYNSSDVIRYALSSHGISYLLRDKRGSVNAWREVENVGRYETTSGRWGNTDCSGLVSAAIRYNGYSAPDRSGKPSLSTALIHTGAQRGQYNMSFVSGNDRNNARHGDVFNFTKSPYGHTFLYNGQTSAGLISTVEAKCTRCGVGRFTKSWNDAANSKFKLVRVNYIYNDVADRNFIIPLSDASASNRTYSRTTYRGSGSGSPDNSTSQAAASSGTYTIKSGDTGGAIASRNGITLAALERANPGINWRRLQIGQVINLP